MAALARGVAEGGLPALHRRVPAPRLRRGELGRCRGEGGDAVRGADRQAPRRVLPVRQPPRHLGGDDQRLRPRPARRVPGGLPRPRHQGRRLLFPDRLVAPRLPGLRRPEPPAPPRRGLPRRRARLGPLPRLPARAGPRGDEQLRQARPAVVRLLLRRHVRREVEGARTRRDDPGTATRDPAQQQAGGKRRQLRLHRGGRAQAVGRRLRLPGAADPCRGDPRRGRLADSVGGLHDLQQPLGLVPRRPRVQVEHHHHPQADRGRQQGRQPAAQHRPRPRRPDLRRRTADPGGRRPVAARQRREHLRRRARRDRQAGVGLLHQPRRHAVRARP